MSFYDTGILMTNGFSVASQKPADLKFIADTISDRDNYVTNNLAYEGMLVFVNQTKKTYQFIDNAWKEFGFNQEEFQASVYDGLDSDSATLALSARQGKLLNTNINNHINDSIKHITSAERTTWNAKASTDVVTTTANGLMSKDDKIKLNGLSNYTHPTNHPASIITQDTNNRFVSDTQINTWNAKANTTTATTSTNGLMSAADKTKLDGIADGATNYTHPGTHPATMITQDTTHRFVTDTQISSWNNKANTTLATQTANGLMSAGDKKKLDGIASNANNYVHPSTHPATMIVQDSNNRFVTDEQINSWNSKPGSISVATPTADGLMSKEDKKKMDGIEEGANKYVHPNNATTRHVSDAQIASWDALIQKVSTLETNYASMLAKLKTAVFYSAE